jgi:hypothetical protein
LMLIPSKLARSVEMKTYANNTDRIIKNLV